MNNDKNGNSNTRPQDTGRGKEQANNGYKPPSNIRRPSPSTKPPTTKGE
ncbi:hypothetical protein L1D44_16310 [Shewanella sp. Isolate13]|nr:hypothetical protein [Shewanella sp. Isolate13]MCG9731360.1 hypothetical protein [Shewanella sp. Isolate13]